jgi:hypothetical protein
VDEKSEEYVSTSTARLERIRELNKKSYEGRSARQSDGDLEGEKVEKNSFDEIMPPPPRYLSLIKERTRFLEDSEADEMPTPPRYRTSFKDKSHSQPELTAPASEAISTRPPFSPPTKSNSRAHTQSLSPPRRPLPSSRMQFATPPSNSKHTNESPSSYYVSTNPDADAISIRSALSDGTPGQRSNSPSSRSNNVAQTTLSVILGRIEDAKENFKKALIEDDVKKQAELASLITRLGEAAVAMRKLEDM